MENLFHMNTAKKTQEPFSSVPSLRLQLHSGKDKPPGCFLFLQPRVAKHLLWVGVDERTEVPFPHPDPMRVVEALL